MKYFPEYECNISNACVTKLRINPYPTAFHTGTVWFYTSTSNKRAARPKTVHKVISKGLKTYV